MFADLRFGICWFLWEWQTKGWCINIMLDDVQTSSLMMFVHHSSWCRYIMSDMWNLMSVHHPTWCRYIMKNDVQTSSNLMSVHHVWYMKLIDMMPSTSFNMMSSTLSDMMSLTSCWSQLPNMINFFYSKFTDFLDQSSIFITNFSKLNNFLAQNFFITVVFIFQ